MIYVIALAISAAGVGLNLGAALTSDADRRPGYFIGILMFTVLVFFYGSGVVGELNVETIRTLDDNLLGVAT